MSHLRNNFTVFIIIISALVLGTVSVMAQNILKSSLYQITNPSIDVERVTNDLNQERVPIVASDDPAYDFMAQSPLGFTVYFKKDPFQGGANIEFKTDRGSIAFHTLSKLTDDDGSFNDTNLASAFRQVRTRASGIFHQVGYDPLPNEVGHVRNGVVNKFDYASVTEGGQGFDMDATYTVSPQELLEELLINSSNDVSELSQQFTVTGVHPEQESDGSINFMTDVVSEFPVVFRIPAPVMYEAANTGARNTDLHYELSKVSAGTYELTKVIDPAGEQWLTDFSRLYPVVIDSTVYIGGAATFNAAATNFISVAALSATSFVVAYENSTTNGQVIVGNIAGGGGTTITYGTPVIFNSAATNYISISKASSTAFVIGYENGTTAGDVKVGNITSTSTVTVGAALVVNNGATNYISVANASSSAFVYGYESSTTTGDVKVGNITSTSTVTVGAALVVNNGATNYISVANASSSAFVYGYESSTTAGDVKVGNITSTSTVTVGATAVVNANTSAFIGISRLTGTSTFVITYASGTAAGVARIGSISSTSTVALGAVAVFNAANTSSTAVAALSSNSFIVTYLNGAAAGNAKAILGTVSGTSTIAFNTAATFNNAAITLTSDSGLAPLNSTSFVVGFNSAGTSGQAVVGTLTPTFSFSISTTSLQFGNLTASNILWATSAGGATAEPAAGNPSTITVTSGAPNGLIVSISDSNASGKSGLYKSTVPVHLATSTAANSVATGTESYGFYVKNVGSALTAAAGFNGGTGTTAISTTAQTILSATVPVAVNNTADIVLKASISATTPAGAYSDALTITATGEY